MINKPLTSLFFLCLKAFFLAICTTTSNADEPAPERPLVIFAAASLTDVLDAHAVNWSTTTQRPMPRLSFGPSGTMARQIAAGAPADMIVSANAHWVTFLNDQGLLADTPKPVAGNTLVLVVPGRHALEGPGHLDAMLLRATIGDGRLAIADPAVAPAGAYAKAFLTKIGLWQALEGRLAFGGSARQTLLLAERGNIPALIYHTDARMSRMVTAIAAAPRTDLPAIIYQAGLTKRSSPAARAFLDYLISEAAANTWLGFGFSLSGLADAPN